MTKSTLHLLQSKGRAEIDNLKASMCCMFFLFDLFRDASKAILPLDLLSASCAVVGVNKNV